MFLNHVPVTGMPRVVEELAADETARSVYVLPEQPELSYPTVAEVADALNARPVAEPRRDA